MKLGLLIRKTIGKIEDDDFLEVIYASLENGKFTENSEAVVIKLDKKERELKTEMISEKYCPGKKYFIEVIFLQEMLEAVSYTHLTLPTKA